MAFYHANAGWYHHGGDKDSFYVSSPLSTIEVKKRPGIHDKKLFDMIFAYFDAEREAIMAEGKKPEKPSNEQKQTS